jgi:hypothetical protein
MRTFLAWHTKPDEIASWLYLLVFLSFACTPVHAAVIVDQFFNPAPPNTFAEVDSNVDHAQTFTVGQAGQLVRVGCLVCRSDLTQQNLMVDIRPTINGVPNPDESSILARGFVSPSQFAENFVFQFVTIDISSFNVIVSAGELLAIVLRPTDRNQDATGYLWYGNTEDMYQGGTRFSRLSDPETSWDTFSNRDMGFITYVNVGDNMTGVVDFALVDPFFGGKTCGPVPEPPTLMLVLPALLLLFIHKYSPSKLLKS